MAKDTTKKVTPPVEKPAAGSLVAVIEGKDPTSPTPETPQVEKADKKASKKEQEGVGYTYIGGGEDSPRVINFMGKQKFVRGVLTPVTDPEVLAKLEGGVKTFVKGEADQETLHRIDEEAKEKADLQRAEDKATDARFKKKHHGE